MVTGQYVVGVDGGASKTVALVGTAGGRILGRGEAGSSNYHNIGSAAASKAIKAAVLDAKKKADLRGRMLETAVVALAAINSQKDWRVCNQFVQHANIAKTSFVIHDSVAALYAATQGRPGIIVISGTGCVAAGINQTGEYVRVGGWGYLVDDEGSAFDIGRKALTTAFRALDGRMQQTRLTSRLRRRYGVKSLDEIQSIIYSRKFSVEEIARLAPLVSAAAKTDKACGDILKQAGISLAQLACTAARRLGMTGTRFVVATVGGNFKSGPYLLRPFAARIRSECPKARIRRLDAEPASGAFWLAMKLQRFQRGSR